MAAATPYCWVLRTAALYLSITGRPVSLAYSLRWAVNHIKTRHIYLVVVEQYIEMDAATHVP